MAITQLRTPMHIHTDIHMVTRILMAIIPMAIILIMVTADPSFPWDLATGITGMAITLVTVITEATDITEAAGITEVAGIMEAADTMEPARITATDSTGIPDPLLTAERSLMVEAVTWEADTGTDRNAHRAKWDDAKKCI